MQFVYKPNLNESRLNLNRCQGMRALLPNWIWFTLTYKNWAELTSNPEIESWPYYLGPPSCDKWIWIILKHKSKIEGPAM